MTTASLPFEVQFRGIGKSFGTCRAVDDLNFSVRSGSIHAIVGENGAGKSTAMNLLYGIFPATQGEILVRGEVIHLKSPADAMAMGIGMIHQHFSLSSTESVLDNILVGTEPTKPAWNWLPHFLRPIDREGAKKKLLTLCREHGLEVNLDAKVETLSVGLQQRVEILKLLFKDAKILILDEPTAVLTPSEITSFFKNLRSLRESGKTILMITHKLEEVLALCDDVTVFKSGRVVGSLPTQQATAESLAELMVGRHVELRSSPAAYRLASDSRPLLSFKNVSLKIEGVQRLEKISFEIRPGEIVGIAGVQGNGQSEIEALLVDPQGLLANPKTSEGEIFLNEQSLRNFSTQQLIHLRMAFVTEDRLKDGLIPSLSCVENYLLGLQNSHEYQLGPTLNWAKVESNAHESKIKYDIKVENLRQPVSSLSGGNQQKLIFARELSKKPHFLLAAQPTRGIDIGAIEFIHQRLKELQQTGAAILLISSELSEILSLSNRILVMSSGRIVDSFMNDSSQPRERLENQIGLAMGGLKA